MNQAFGMKEINNKGVLLDLKCGNSTADVKSSSEVVPLHNDSSSPCEKVKGWCSRKFTLGLVKKRLPILVWLPKYNIDDLKGDLIAGMTVALTVIPQGLALASLAKLPPEYGLYTSFMGCFMYAIFGSCKNLTIGPTAIMSLMTAEHTSKGGIVYVILLTFLTGCIQLLMGILNLGFIMTFISSSVVSGFTSAAAITIATTQICGLFGIKSNSESFLDDVKTFYNGMVNKEYKIYDILMGLCSIAFLFFLKYSSKLRISFCGSMCQRIWEIFFKTISTARNALLVLSCGCIAAILLSYDIDELTLTKEVEAGLPSFEFPSFSYHSFDNTTNTTIDKDFIDIVQHMGSGLVILPLLCLLEAIAIAKSFSKGKKIDATQEMIAIGLSNIMGSFVSAYPATGSFSRTAINYSSGVRTTAGGILTGSLVLLALAFMSPYFKYIPKASLSALIFISVLNMVHYKDVIVMWKTNKWDLLPFLATFLLSFGLGLEYGIIAGISLSLIMLLFQASKPTITILERETYLGCKYIFVQPDRSILFPSAEKLQTIILKTLSDFSGKSVCCVVLDCCHISTADYTMTMNVKSLVSSLRNDNVKVIFVNLKMEVQSSIKGADLEEFTNFPSKEEAENFIDAVSVCPSSPPSYNGALTRHSLRSDDVSFTGT